MEDWREGDDLMTSGWMRATAPSGNAAYEGEVQWSGELGYGVRAPEGGQSGRRDDEATGTKPLREVLEAHLLDEDIPLAHRGMHGRVWRAKKGAERNRRKMDDMRGRMKESRPHARRPSPPPRTRCSSNPVPGERLSHVARHPPPRLFPPDLARRPGLRRRGGRDLDRRRRRGRGP